MKVRKKKHGKNMYWYDINVIEWQMSKVHKENSNQDGQSEGRAMSVS